jgi:hypothetical protein
MEAVMKTTLLVLILAAAALAFVGCDEKTDYVIVEEIVYVYDEDDPPPVPQGVYSITRDEEVLLYWLPIDDVNGDFDTYIVYRSDHHPDTGYWEIGRTTGEYFVNRNLVNGHTYYYAVSSVDLDGNLSDLSYEYVLDTPRPQGSNRTLIDLDVEPDYAGWDLSDSNNVNYLSGACDFYLDYDGVFYLNVGNIDTDIQDMGYTEDLDEIDYAPEFGWSQNGWCEVILRHTYIIWTDNNHFAKVRVISIDSDRIIFDWAYQVDPGNLELKPKVERNPDYLRHPRGGK